jgi:hypothetical protein
VAVVLTGIVFDVWDTYDPAFVGGFVFLVLAGVASFAIRERKYSIRYQQPQAITPATPVAGVASDGD